MKSLLIGLLLALPFVSCKTQKKIYTPETYDREIITFGSGGGFTGKVVKYQILRNGQMFTSSMGSSQSNEMAGLDKKTTDQLFLNLINLKIPEMTLDDPGNMYRYISYSENGNVHKVTWGGKNVEVPKSLKDYYKLLNQFATKNKGIIK